MKHLTFEGEISNIIKGLKPIVEHELGSSGGRTMKTTLFFIYGALQNLYERLGKLERPGK